MQRTEIVDQAWLRVETTITMLQFVDTEGLCRSLTTLDLRLCNLIQELICGQDQRGKARVRLKQPNATNDARERLEMKLIRSAEVYERLSEK